MTIFTIGELIELAIGSPEPGHVNFMALQCLLHSFAEKMHIMHDKVDLDKYVNFAKVIKASNSKAATSTATATATATSTATAVTTAAKLKKVAQVSPRKRTNVGSNVKTKQLNTTSSTADSSLEPTSGRSNSSSSGKLPQLHRALASIIDQRFNMPNNIRMKDRLAGGADEPPPAEEATAPEAETAATEEAPATATTEEAPPPPAAPAEETAEAPTAPATETEVEAAPAAAEATATEPPPPSEQPVEQMEEATVEAPVEQPAAPIAEPAMSQTQLAAATSGYEMAPMRLSRLHLPMTSLPEDLRVGIAIMKDQLDLAMEELSILTTLMINNKIDPQRIGQLRMIASRLRAIQRDNVYIEGTHRTKFEEKSVSWIEAEGEMEEELMEEAFTIEEEIEASKEEEKSSTRSATPSEQGEQERYDLGLHVCYSPDKMLEQVMDLKSEFCTLTNKVNEIAAQLLKHDSHRMMMILTELQEQMRDLKLFTVMAKDIFDRFESDRANNIRNIDEIRRDIESLQERKIDRAEVEVLLSEKVDYQQLARKVNIEQLQQLQCRMERQFCEMNKLICLTERGLKALIEELRTTLGFNAVEEILKKFKASMDADICAVAQKLQKYIDATNDDCAAAGARFKVLQDLACVSCDTECVMRTAERSKVPKLKSAHATESIAPLVTYELSSIRKSGVMGYFRKDEFPDSPNAWLKRQGTNATLKMCVPRHAGGSHTTYTAKDRVEKILMQKKA